MKNRMKTTPRLETLESVTLLSGVAAAALPATHAEISFATPTTVPLRGVVSGTSHANKFSGTTYSDGTSSFGYTIYDIKASGKVTPIGPAKVTGHIQLNDGPSFGGPPPSSLVLSSKGGTLTLHMPASIPGIVGTPTASSPRTVVETYVVEDGTGDYSGLTGTGVVEFTSARAGSNGYFGAGRLSIKFTHFDAVANTTPLDLANASAGRLVGGA